MLTARKEQGKGNDKIEHKAQNTEHRVGVKEWCGNGSTTRLSHRLHRFSQIKDNIENRNL